MSAGPDNPFGDDDARLRFLSEYAQVLSDRARRREAGRQSSQTPWDAALELIEIAVESLSSSTGKLPGPIQVYLRESLQGILDGKDADVALGIRATKGRRPLDDLVVSTVLAHVELGKRIGLPPSDAIARTLRAVEAIVDGGRTRDWLDDLLEKHHDKVTAMQTLSDEEVEALADIDEHIRNQMQ